MAPDGTHRFARHGWSVPIHALVDLDRDLGSGLSVDRLEAARVAVEVPVLTRRRGPWHLERRPPATPQHLGLLIVDGVVARQIVVGDVVSSELLGADDFVLPWLRCPEHGAAGELVRWQVLATLRVAVLDHRAAVALGAFPEIHQAIIERVAVQGERLAALKAFSQVNSVERRLLALFRHIAQRWGRVTTRGIVIPLALSHRLLGELVGARRPSVTCATTALAREGSLLRSADGTWLLTAHADDDGASTATAPTPQARSQLLIASAKR